MPAGLLSLLILALGVSSASAQAGPLVGSWHGTSTCVDKAHWPACHDEQVIYDVRAKAGTQDTVTVRADKVVHGVREFMAEFDFVGAPGGVWVADFSNGRTHGHIELRVVGRHMTGRFTDVSSGRQVRSMALDRAG